ncbi:MAG: sigma-54 dependent transcriptional regulator [Candidatus Cloacimonetes bacterium]|jgi:DNA-binding NtrC family response regulator|nr:sigma-54 dependent transcriptional regulator [Candidatus Cloacimonadota bacterium]
MSTILIIDDEQNIRNIIKLLLKNEGYDVLDTESGEKAIELFNQNEIDVAITDLNLPGINGIETMQQIKNKGITTQFVFITAHGTFSAAVEAMKSGAYNFISKPFDNDELISVIQGALNVKQLTDKLKALESQLYSGDPFKDIIGNSHSLKKVLKLASRVANSDFPVLVTGESGTGKELLVRAIHKLSKRKNSIFIPVNCAAIPHSLFESEFFGHIKGAFTGATTTRKGKFQEADGGTIFLDEVGEMPLEFQAKLLRVIESGEYTIIGENFPKTTNVRIIAATNKNLEEMVHEKLFREDLFYRLNIFPIEIPSLRERKDDIILLARHFLNQINKKLQLNEKTVSTMLSYPWYGNIRELKNEMQRVSILTDTIIYPDHLSIKQKINTKEVIDFPEKFSLESHLKDVERNYYYKAMEIAENNKTKAAQLLGVSYRIFNYTWSKLQEES